MHLPHIEQLYVDYTFCQFIKCGNQYAGFVLVCTCTLPLSDFPIMYQCAVVIEHTSIYRISYNCRRALFFSERSQTRLLLEGGAYSSVYDLDIVWMYLVAPSYRSLATKSAYSFHRNCNTLQLIKLSTCILFETGTVFDVISASGA